jgi:hypothetical protein
MNWSACCSPHYHCSSDQRDQQQPLRRTIPWTRSIRNLVSPTPTRRQRSLNLPFSLADAVRSKSKVRSANGEWQTFEATWLGRFILDGYAIADEYRMTGSSGEVIVLGMNLRTYDAISGFGTLNGSMRWLERDWISDRRSGVESGSMGNQLSTPAKNRWPATLIRAPLTRTFP